MNQELREELERSLFRTEVPLADIDAINLINRCISIITELLDNTDDACTVDLKAKFQVTQLALRGLAAAKLARAGSWGDPSIATSILRLTRGSKFQGKLLERQDLL